MHEHADPSSQDELIPFEESLSPRLKFLRENHLRVYNDGQFWICRNAGYTREVSADSEDNAIIAYCEKYNIRHYSLPPHS